MKYQKKSLPLIIILLVIFNSVFGQVSKQEKMKLLHFMVGEWVGTSTIYDNGKISKQVPAFQKISYDLNKNIIVIELHSELLQLHTVIYYDEEDKKYYYYPFSKNGVAKIPAEYKNGQLIVSRSADNRFVFSTTEEGGFREYGEKLINGKWIKYFEDNFKNIQ